MSLFWWFLLAAIAFWYWRRVRYLAKWDHIPGYKSYSR